MITVNHPMGHASSCHCSNSATQHHSGTVMAAVFYNRDRVLVNYSVDCGKTITGVYCTALIPKTVNVVKDKMPEKVVPTKCWFVMTKHQEAHPPSLVATTYACKAATLNCRVPIHPPCDSYQLSDFSVFTPLQDSLCGRTFKSVKKCHSSHKYCNYELAEKISRRWCNDISISLWKGYHTSYSWYCQTVYANLM